jgi:hypothetical protein
MRYLLFIPAVLLLFFSCSSTPSNSGKNVKVYVEGVSTLKLKSIAQNRALTKDISGYFPGVTNDVRNCYSGPADFVRITLTGLRLDTIGESSGWEGHKELYIDGSGFADTSGIDLKIPRGKVTNMHVFFDGPGYISGTLTGPFAGCSQITNTFYTKSNYSTYLGGAPDCDYFTNGPAEETVMDISGFTNPGYGFNFDVPIYNAGSEPTLTIVVDLDRALAFYDNRYPFSDDCGVSNAAYFYPRINGSVAVFYGTPGTIQGYEAQFKNQNGKGYGAWMTLVLDPDGNFISGMMTPDNGNDICDRGRISDWDGSNFIYDAGTVGDIPLVNYMSNFTIVNILSNTSSTATWYCPYKGQYGQAAFQLVFQK